MPPSAALLAEFAARYIWWRDPEPPSGDRVMMNLGTFEDVRRLEAVCAAQELHAVMSRAQPGWIGPRAWSYWRARLSGAGREPIPMAPPRRRFLDELP